MPITMPEWLTRKEIVQIFSKEFPEINNHYWIDYLLYKSYRKKIKKRFKGIKQVLYYRSDIEKLIQEIKSKHERN
jgi:hypothetical protein